MKNVILLTIGNLNSQLSIIWIVSMQDVKKRFLWKQGIDMINKLCSLLVFERRIMLVGKHF